MSWDDEEVVTAAVASVGLTSNWDGEDQDEEPVLGEDWDAEPQKIETVKVVPGARAPTKAQTAKKKEADERKAREEGELERLRMKNDPKAAELSKEEIAKAQEAAELRLARDAFGGDDIDAPANAEFKNEQLDLDNVDIQGSADSAKLADIKTDDPLQSIALNTEQDYIEFGDKVVTMAAKAGNNNKKFMLAFISSVLDKGTKGLKLDDANKLQTKIAGICAGKQKEEAGNKKKPGAASKKASLPGGKSSNRVGFGEDDRHGGLYDDYY